MKCQILFSRKNTKNIISLSSAEFSGMVCDKIFLYLVLFHETLSGY